jgi:hypothetical protein
VGDVVNLQERMRRKWQTHGETTFMLCSCGSQYGLLPVVLHDAGEPLIVAIMCPECERESDVCAGRVMVGQKAEEVAREDVPADEPATPRRWWQFWRRK